MTLKITPELLAELRKRAEAAPRGQTTVNRFDNPGGEINYQIQTGHDKTPLFANTSDLDGPRVREWANHIARADPTTVLALVEEIERCHRDLAECFRLSGADPDGDEDWRLSLDAVRAVREFREEFDAVDERIAAGVPRHQCGRDDPDDGREVCGPTEAWPSAEAATSAPKSPVET